MHKFRLPYRSVALLAVVLELAACNSTPRVESRDQAAAVLVSVTTVGAWDQLADAVQPNFVLTGDAALREVAPVTQRIQEHTLRAFGVAAGFGTPQSSESSTDTRTRTTSDTDATTDGTPTSTASTTSSTSSTDSATRQPGVAATPATGIPAGAQRPATPAVAGEIGFDPVLKYQAALSLYQTVQLMNRQVQNAASIGCFAPFLVQLKIAVIPYRRHLPYDVHARVSFFRKPDAETQNISSALVGSDATVMALQRALDSGAVQADPALAEQVLKLATEAAATATKAALAATKAAVTANEAAETARQAASAAKQAAAQNQSKHAAHKGQAQPRECANKENGSAANLPIVLPLLVTDDIERSLKARAVETARQISIGLNSLVHGLAANAGINAVNQQLAAIMGQDINSRLTVTRQSDNTLYARIGAANSPTSEYSLIGQTYDISLVLLVPRGYFPDTGIDPIIDMHVFPQFRHAVDGKELPGRTRETLLAQTTVAMSDILSGAQLAGWKRMDDGKKEEIVRELARPVNENNWDKFVGVVKTYNGLSGDGNTPLSNGQQRSLWTRISALIADSPVKTTFFELPRPRSIVIPAQNVVVLDDGKAAAQIQLRDATGVSSRSVSGSLVLRKKKEGDKQVEYRLVANGVAYDNATGVLTLAFPSLTKWAIDDLDLQSSVLEIRQRCDQALCATFEGEDTFPIAAIAPKPAPAPPKFELIAPVKRIVAKDSQAMLIVDVDKLPGDEVLVLSVGNANLQAAAEGAVALPISKNRVTVKQNSTVKLELRNVQPGTNVTLEAESKKGDASTGKKNLEFSVEAAK